MNSVTSGTNEYILQPSLLEKLRDHENRLADMLKTKDELKTQYFKEHETRFVEYKEELFEFIEKLM